MELDFVTLEQIAICLPKDISVCIRGRHGIGKSEFVRKLAKILDLPIIERRLSQMSEGDLIGLPDQHDHETTNFLPPDWFKQAMDSPALIFLDEFDRADLPVKQAAMELILDRCIQGKKIHEDCRIYAAINGGKYGSNYHVKDLDLAVNDRFWVADVEPSVEDWLAWANKDENVILEIIDFITANPTDLELKKMPKVAHEVTPSRRSWTRLSKTLNANPHLLEKESVKSMMFRSLCEGFVGADSASRFVRILKDRHSNISVEDILNRFIEHEEKISNRPLAEQNHLVEKLKNHSANQKKSDWTKDQVRNVVKFFHTLTPEGKINMWDRLTQSDCKIENSKPFANQIGSTIQDLL